MLKLNFDNNRTAFDNLQSKSNFWQLLDNYLFCLQRRLKRGYRVIFALWILTIHVIIKNVWEIHYIWWFCEQWCWVWIQYDSNQFLMFKTYQVKFKIYLFIPRQIPFWSVSIQLGWSSICLSPLSWLPAWSSRKQTNSISQF